MASILFPSGGKMEARPANGVCFELAELQSIVEGHIEVIPTKDGRVMVLNDMGKLIGLPRNAQAGALVALQTPESIAEAKALYGENLIIIGDTSEPDYIAGTVLVCESHEVQ